jgi:hypothetical protein
MKRYGLLYLSIFLLFSACEKERVSEDFQSETLIRQIGTSEEDMQVFTYHNNRSIFEYLTRFSYRKYLYNDLNQLERINIAQSLNPLSCAIIPGTGFDEGDDPRKAKISQFVKFEYSGSGKLSKTHWYFVNEDVEEYMYSMHFEYDGERVVRVDTYTPQDQLIHYYTYQYDSLGNVDEELYFAMLEGSGAVLQSRTVTEFDTLVNPFRVFAAEGIPGTNTNANNITRTTYFYYYSEIEESYTREFEYEYNSLGYPIMANDVQYMYGEEEQ